MLSRKDRRILIELQLDSRLTTQDLAERVGMSTSATWRRVKSLEEAGVITGYVALVDARRLGKDVTAFLGVSTEQPRSIGSLERQIIAIPDVLECHHVSGAHTLMVKVKTENTESLEALIDRIRGLEGVNRTETMVVLSTHLERQRVALDLRDEFVARPRSRGRGGRSR